MWDGVHVPSRTKRKETHHNRLTLVLLPPYRSPPIGTFIGGARSASHKRGFFLGSTFTRGARGTHVPFAIASSTTQRWCLLSRSKHMTIAEETPSSRIKVANKSWAEGTRRRRWGAGGEGTGSANGCEMLNGGVELVAYWMELVGSSELVVVAIVNVVEGNKKCDFREPTMPTAASGSIIRLCAFTEFTPLVHRYSAFIRRRLGSLGLALPRFPWWNSNSTMHPGPRKHRKLADFQTLRSGCGHPLQSPLDPL
ncbi:hypothetical protein DFH09DRAFT_1313637 [Mycena vulgaris]|nr:hypothetical protein DFH09DRAFT_1313637 [Mycena vulgaris]